MELRQLRDALQAVCQIVQVQTVCTRAARNEVF